MYTINIAYVRMFTSDPIPHQAGPREISQFYYFIEVKCRHGVQTWSADTEPRYVKAALNYTQGGSDIRFLLVQDI